MSPYLGIGLVVAGYCALHLYVCDRCQRLAAEWIDNDKDTLRSFWGQQ